MSIPPLVCSTPPPPDQCEDDKDPEDFDIQYHLSQDDDEENYDFGSFATYNHFQSAINKVNITEIPKVIVNDKADDSLQGQTMDTDINLGTNITCESKLELDEEILEDLGLKLDEETLEPAETTEIESTDSNLQSPRQEKQAQNVSKKNLDDVTTDQPPSDEFVEERHSPEIVDEPPSYVDEIIAAVDDLQIASEAERLNLHNFEIQQEIATRSPDSSESIKEIQLKPIENVVSNTANIDNDFGDFDDFQFASSEDKPATVINSCDNPWDSKNVTENSFGDFKASFDDKENNLFSAPTEHAEHSIQSIQAEVKVEDGDISENDDEFGDFNDFKSSSVEPQSSFSDEITEQVAVFNLPTDNEAQLMESINNVIFSVFEDEMPVIEEEFDSKLESVLGETWGYLLQIDERQPYIVNWNNSLGQKTLLKALCIDSRNILFGPKWNYCMPKYAANLSVAPLLPQKQPTSSTPQSEVVNPEKITIKASAWSDPFTSEGQDSCNADSAPNAVIEAGPTDLDVFEASTSSKADKIYSSTLNVQPLRQINLPETHIFTPTDSETPRSTTIHYDRSLPVLLPQTVIETSKIEPNFKSVTDTNSKTDNDDYWEFQDFKGTSSIVTATHAVSSSTEKGDITNSSLNVSYGTQVLQPMKIEPIIPTLNWPDPGEVKETFDDFSDFVSSSTISNVQQAPAAPVQLESKFFNETDKPGTSNEISSNERIANTPSNNTDDDFDTFQSALPSSISMNFNVTSVTSPATISQAADTLSQAVQLATDFNYAFPKINNVKSETISIESTTKPKDTTQNQTSYFPNHFEVNKPPDFIAKGSPIQTTTIPVMSASLLQPTPANLSSISQNQQKSAQILQPLSLESYSQINWPNPGIDLQDLSRFNPVETLHSLKTDLSVNNQSKVASPIHNSKGLSHNQGDDDIWGDFVSSKPRPAQQAMPKKQTTFADDDEWTEFVSSPSVKPQNGLNTISFNVHTNSNIQKSNSNLKRNQVPMDIPTLNYITPKTSSQKAFKDRHFQNL